MDERKVIELEKNEVAGRDRCASMGEFGGSGKKEKGRWNE